MITDRDMRTQVEQILDGDAADFDVDGIVSALIERFGRCDVGEIECGPFWLIVREHDRTVTACCPVCGSTRESVAGDAQRHHVDPDAAICCEVVL